MSANDQKEEVVDDPEQDTGVYSTESICLMLQPDGEGEESSSTTEFVKEVMFKRDERGEGELPVVAMDDTMSRICRGTCAMHAYLLHAGSLDDSAADLLGIHGERVRCFSLPGFEKKLGLSVHMYIDLQGMEHKLPHNTNATQLFLIAHLPDEPPQVYPSSIHGPVLLSAENFKTEEYVNLTMADWAKIKSLCKAVQPNAQFLPYEPPSAEDDTRDLGDDD